MVGRRKFLSDIFTGGVPASLTVFSWLRSQPRDDMRPLEASPDAVELTLKLGTIWSKIKGEDHSISGGTAFVSIRNTGARPLSGVRVALYQYTTSTGYTLLGNQTVTIQPEEVRFPRFDLPASVTKELVAKRIHLTASCFSPTTSHESPD